MTTWRANKNPYDFPVLFHKIALSEKGKYELVTFKTDSGRAKGKAFKEKWKYFLWTVRKHNYLKLFALMERKTFRLSEEKDEFGFSTIWVTVDQNDEDELISNLKKALKK